MIQRLSFLASFLVYLERGELVPRPEVADLLGVQAETDSGLHLELDNYLMGVLTMCNELVRSSPAIFGILARDLYLWFFYSY